ncbi:hypothetical protein [Cysteiniphilum marinum]|nr:hypothetical protein [Cysteiniphilum marinum]
MSGENILFDIEKDIIQNIGLYPQEKNNSFKFKEIRESITIRNHYCDGMK